MASELTSVLTSPLLAAAQEPPALKLRNTPSPVVPTYTTSVFTGFTASAVTTKLVSPTLIAAQLSPPSTLLNTPWPVTPA